MTADSRVSRLRERMADLEVDSFLVSSSANRRYLSGFTGSSGNLVITQTEALLVTDFRYLEQAANESPGFTVHRMKGGEPWFPDLAADLGLQRVGFEANDLSVAQYRRLVKTMEESEVDAVVEFEETTGVVEQIRAIKDPQELEFLRRAIQIADDALAAVSSDLQPGMTEKQVSWALHQHMRELGAEGPSFESIVGIGANAALPHHRADDTELKLGEPIVIDMGANYRGYCSDLTRTFLIGESNDKFEHIYGIVLRAQQAAIAAAKPGMTGAELDEIARDVITEAGYGDEFGHGLGHGVGLAVHERPMIVPTSEDQIENGMLFTIEPGIYIPGWGGVRIEDIVLMDEGGATVLTESPK